MSPLSTVSLNQQGISEMSGKPLPGRERPFFNILFIDDDDAQVLPSVEDTILKLIEHKWTRGRTFEVWWTSDEEILKKCDDQAWRDFFQFFCVDHDMRINGPQVCQRLRLRGSRAFRLLYSNVPNNEAKLNATAEAASLEPSHVHDINATISKMGGRGINILKLLEYLEPEFQSFRSRHSEIQTVLSQSETSLAACLSDLRTKGFPINGTTFLVDEIFPEIKDMEDAEAASYMMRFRARVILSEEFSRAVNRHGVATATHMSDRRTKLDGNGFIETPAELAPACTRQILDLKSNLVLASRENAPVAAGFLQQASKDVGLFEKAFPSNEADWTGGITGELTKMSRLRKRLFQVKFNDINKLFGSLGRRKGCPKLTALTNGFQTAFEAFFPRRLLGPLEKELHMLVGSLVRDPKNKPQMFWGAFLGKRVGPDPKTGTWTDHSFICIAQDLDLSAEQLGVSSGNPPVWVNILRNHFTCGKMLGHVYVTSFAVPYIHDVQRMASVPEQSLPFPGEDLNYITIHQPAVKAAIILHFPIASDCAYPEYRFDGVKKSFYKNVQ